MNFKPYPKPPKKEKKKSNFGTRPSRGNFGKTKSKPMRQTQFKYKRIATDKDLGYLEWFSLQSIKCFNCNCVAEEAHHIKGHSYDSKDHKSLLPLCCNCHKYSTTLSVHGTPVKWRERYTIEEQLDYAREIYQQYLKEMNLWKQEKNI